MRRHFTWTNAGTNREYELLIRDALEFGRNHGEKGDHLVNFAAYIIRRDGIMSKEKSERRVREYMEQSG